MMNNECRPTLQPDNDPVFGLVMLIMISIMCVFMLCGCKSTKEIVEVEKFRDVYHNTTDTIKDSVYVNKYVDRYVKGDTVYVLNTEYIYKYKNRIKTDTLLRTDTIYQYQELSYSEPEVKEMTWFEKIKCKTWNLMFYILLGFVGYFLMSRVKGS